jgi:hypothetical protein
MKRKLHYLLIIPLFMLAQSCTKSVLSPGYDQVDGSQIVGSWYLNEAAQNSGGGWNYFKTGLEKGVFTFYGNGAASYDDGYNQMDGTWSIVTLSAGYYDRYGSDHSDLHQSFRLRLYDSYTNNSVTLDFDDIYFGGGALTGTSYTNNTISRYVFYRYNR